MSARETPPATRADPARDAPGGAVNVAPDDGGQTAEAPANAPLGSPASAAPGDGGQTADATEKAPPGGPGSAAPSDGGQMAGATVKAPPGGAAKTAPRDRAGTSDASANAAPDAPANALPPVRAKTARVPAGAAPEVDVAILGGGCGGLSLGFRLCDTPLSVRIVEPRETYTADRIWSFWRTRLDPFEDCVVGRWARWSVTAGARRIVRGSDTLRYETVSAGLFYRKCLDRIGAAPNVTLDPGTRVEGLRREGAGFVVDTDRGPLRARRVVDTRPLGVRPAYAQSFVGDEVEAAQDVFDPDTVELMSFGAPLGDGIFFLYVLPFDRRRALVEATVFGPPEPDAGALRRRLDAALHERLAGAPFRVLRQEAGAIPMDGANKSRARPGYLPLGLRGGAARPSTGYAFARIQQMSDGMADALLRGAPARIAPLDGPVTRHMDRLFLKVIRRHPGRGPDLFADLFEGASPDRLERFLSGSTAPLDRLAVMAALPPGLFARTALVP